MLYPHTAEIYNKSQPIQLNLDLLNQAKSIPVFLLNLQIQILDKSVTGFPSYDRTDY